MVEAYGAELLSGIQEQSLASFLLDLQAYINPEPKLITGLPTLDDLIVKHRYTTPTTPNAPRFDEFGLLITDPIDPEDESDDTFRIERPVPVTLNVALHDDGSTAASWYLVHHLISLSTIPRELGGQASCVVLIDCTGRFSAKALDHQLQAVLASKNRARLPSTIQDIARLSLSHVHVMQASSLQHLITSLHELPDYILSEANHSAARSLSALIVTGINNFQWQSRAEAELASLENDQPPPVSNGLILTELKALQDRFSCIVLYTSTTSTVSMPNSNQREPAETPTIDPFSQNALVNLFPTRSSVLRFVSEMTIDACLLDKDKRRSAVAASNQNYHFASRPGGQSRRKVTAGDFIEPGFDMKIGQGGAPSFVSGS